MLGYQSGALTPERRSWADRLHPDDRPRIERTVHDHVVAGEDYTLMFRLRSQGRGQGRSLLLSQAQRPRGAVPQPEQPGRAQRPVCAPLAVQTQISGSKGHLLSDRVHQELACGVLEQKSHPPAQGQPPEPAVPDHLAPPGANHPRQDPGQGALARAVQTHQGGELSRVQGEVQVV